MRYKHARVSVERSLDARAVDVGCDFMTRNDRLALRLDEFTRASMPAGEGWDLVSHDVLAVVAAPSTAR
jgi:hypothetical protein